MKKKLITSVTALGLSLGIIGSAGAEEVSQTVYSPMETLSKVQSSNLLLNAKKFHKEYRYYPKSQYSMSSQTPSSHFVTTSDGFGGAITKKSVEPWGNNGDWWKVEYSGTLTKFEM